MADNLPYHIPVLLQQCIEGLDIKEDGIYVDLTFGGGGHSKEILKKLKGGRLFSFDQDDDALENAKEIDDRSFTFVAANFRYLAQFLKYHKIEKVDGILADLGVSSHQFDEAERGFSIRFDSDLDMRMDQKTSKSAYHVLNEYPEKELIRIFREYGELKNAFTISKEIVQERSFNPLKTTEDLMKLLERHTKKGHEHKFYAQLFQAIRIEVNQELKALELALEQCAKVLKPGGRLVVMSYHSLEDRLVKNFIRTGNISGEVEKDFYGKYETPWEIITKKPIEPSENEKKLNSRSRSAKLRIAERL